MACGCAKNIQTSGPAAAPIDDGSFNVEGSGEEIKHQKRAFGVIQALTHNAGAARPMIANPPQEGEVVKEKPDTNAMADAARRINKEKHNKAISLAQLQRTKAAMCFVCPVVSSCGTRCLLAANHTPDQMAQIDRPYCDNPPEFHKSNAVAWLVTQPSACPLGRHPCDEDHVTQWAPWWFPITLRWYGVPEPLRWAIAVRRWKSDTLPNCGCIVALTPKVIKSCETCHVIVQRAWPIRIVGALFSKAPQVRRAFNKGKVFASGPDEVWARASRYSRRWLVRWMKRAVRRRTKAIRKTNP